MTSAAKLSSVWQQDMPCLLFEEEGSSAAGSGFMALSWAARWVPLTGAAVTGRRSYGWRNPLCNSRVCTLAPLLPADEEILKEKSQLCILESVQSMLFLFFPLVINMVTYRQHKLFCCNNLSFLSGRWTCIVLANAKAIGIKITAAISMVIPHCTNESEKAKGALCSTEPRSWGHVGELYWLFCVLHGSLYAVFMISVFWNTSLHWLALWIDDFCMSLLSLVSRILFC